MPEAGIVGSERLLYPTVSARCNYLFLPLILVSGTQVLKCICGKLIMPYDVMNLRQNWFLVDHLFGDKSLLVPMLTNRQFEICIKMQAFHPWNTFEIYSNNYRSVVTKCEPYKTVLLNYILSHSQLNLCHDWFHEYQKRIPINLTPNILFIW